MVVSAPDRQADSHLPVTGPRGEGARVEPPRLGDDGLDDTAADDDPAAVTGDVHLRAVTAADAPALVALLADPDHQRWCHRWPSVDAAAASVLIESWAREWDGDSAFSFAIDVAGRCVGLTRLDVEPDGAAQLIVTLTPEMRGRSVASTAVRLLLVWAFAQVGLPVVHWVGEVGNWSGRRVAWACGFVVEGTIRDFVVGPDGTRRDAWVASVRWPDPLRPTQPWLAPPVLDGEGVQLGPHEPGDVDRIAQACSAASTQEWLPTLPTPYTVLDAAAFLATREEDHASGRAMSWAVRTPGGLLVATVSLFHLGRLARGAEIGYWAHPDARGRGLTSAAVRVLARYALTPVRDGGLGLTRLELKAATGNLASRRVAEKAGFVQVGTDRDAELLRDGSRTDFVCYDLLPADLGILVSPGPGSSL